MAKRMRSAFLLVAACVLVFWMAFRSGEIHGRVKKNIIKIEPPVVYYVVETLGSGDEKHAYFAVVDESHPIIRFYRNDATRDLLKKGAVEIYLADGKRIY